MFFQELSDSITCSTLKKNAEVGQVVGNFLPSALRVFFMAILGAFFDVVIHVYEKLSFLGDHLMRFHGNLSLLTVEWDYFSPKKCLSTAEIQYLS